MTLSTIHPLWHALWPQQLAAGLAALRIDLGPDQQRRLLDYLALLNKWNRAYNLTAIRDPKEMVGRQLLDSLSILSLVRGPRVLDVGSGAGLPGIPLAIALPEVQFSLLDSNGKKTRFVQQAVLELGLPNVTVIQGRVEDFHPAEGFDTITARAFADLPRMLGLLGHLLAQGAGLVAMKGSVPAAEIAALEAQGVRIEVRRLELPGDPAERHAVLLRLGG
jgi:16S rRNA (guanine527-N7)-methyltransferase